jgi:polyphosphate kinase 2 (PPK2 family)
VHPEFLDGQWLPEKLRERGLDAIWQSRYDDINRFEKVMSDRNTLFIKFFLHVSYEEQRERFLKRLEDPEKNWKFSLTDVKERVFWEDYQRAYEDMLNATSTTAAPWYVIPADKKWFARACVADVITARMAELDLKYPRVDDKDQAAMKEAKRKLESELKSSTG